jgi:hypothetical protein
MERALQRLRLTLMAALSSQHDVLNTSHVHPVALSYPLAKSVSTMN